MNVEIEFENYSIKSPKMPDPFNVKLINAVGSGGGGGGNEVELTWAEYEALSEAEKMNGTNYFITDINTTKSLTSKVLLETSSISQTSYTLSDNISNYDYLLIEIIKSNQENIRGNMIVKPNCLGGTVTTYLNSSWYGAIEFAFSNGTTFTIEGISQRSSVITSYSKIRITGYIYQRVVVPNQMINYSTVEAKIGTWIDGKPLYQKTITGRTPSSSYDYFGDAIENFEHCYYYEGVLIPDDANSSVNSIFYNRPDNNNAEYYIVIESNGKVFIRTYSSQASTFYVTIRYTKTTD